MKINAVTPVLNVSDVIASIRWFESVGWSRSFSWNDGGMIKGALDSNARGPAQFAGLCADPARNDGPMLFLCRDGQGSRDPRPYPGRDRDDFGGVWMTWWVPDVDGAHAECVKAGVEVVREPVTEPWGVREFLLRHPDGHYFRVSGHVR